MSELKSIWVVLLPSGDVVAKCNTREGAESISKATDGKIVEYAPRDDTTERAAVFAGQESVITRSDYVITRTYDEWKASKEGK